MKRKKLIEQLRKLRGLIERGATEHERDTAQRIYDTLCQKHGITADELFEPFQSLSGLSLGLYMRDGRLLFAVGVVSIPFRAVTGFVPGMYFHYPGVIGVSIPFRAVTGFVLWPMLFSGVESLCFNPFQG